MSSGSTYKDENNVRHEPFQNIGANDLVRVGYTMCGFLRKKGKIERLIEKRVSVNWRQKYVILSEGCIYVFSNELSKSPSQGFSLSAYSSVAMVDHPSMHYVFEVRPKDPQKRPHIFACESDEKRLEWMRNIYEFIMLANSQYPPSNIKHLQYIDIDGVDVTQASKMQYETTLPKRPDMPLPEIPTAQKNKARAPAPLPSAKEKEMVSEYDLENEEEDDEYTEPDNFTPPTQSKDKGRQFGISLPGMALPAHPVSEKKEAVTSPTSLKPKKPLPAVPVESPKELPVDKRTSSGYRKVEVRSVYYNEDDLNEFILDSSDNNEAQRLLKGKPQGTFLIRNSSSGPSEKVLVYQSDEGFKQMKILKEGDKVWLTPTEKFDNIIKLLEYYKQNNLPTRQMKLFQGYNR
ncbi:hypothetical protein ACJMK2_005558 [Sinanodonta woodiana]|uniref:Uncharacterized protein n=1 Tax=Sinanodonta woodiana TaxID=1069815 RepID=A0ABD3VQH4_SINWO